jgi:hypothetical protein
MSYDPSSDEILADLSNGEYNPEGVEKEMASGGRIPPGKYHVRLESVGEQKATANSVLYWPLKFTVLAGPEKGRTITENLNAFRPNAHDDRDKKSNNRYLLFASRLGELSTAGGKYSRLKPNLAACVGAEVVVEIVHQPKKDQPSVVYANISFGGIYSVTDPKLKGVPMATAGDKLPAPAPAKYDTSNL